MKRNCFKSLLLLSCITFMIAGCADNNIEENVTVENGEQINAVEPEEINSAENTAVEYGERLSAVELEKINSELSAPCRLNALINTLNINNDLITFNHFRLFKKLDYLNVNADSLTVFHTEELAGLKAEGIMMPYDYIEIDAVEYGRIPYNLVHNRIEANTEGRLRDLLLDKLVKCREITYASSLESTVHSGFFSEKYDCFYTEPVFYYSYNNEESVHFTSGYKNEDKIYLFSDKFMLTFTEKEGSYILTGFEKLPDTAKSATQAKQTKVKLVVKTEFLQTDSTKSRRYNKAITAYNDFLANRYSHQGYVDEVRRNSNLGAGYRILEMTGDDVPELIIKGYAAFSSFYIYTYTGGEVKEIGSYGISGDGGSTILSNGTVVFRMNNTERLSYDFYSYNPNFTTNVFSFGRYLIYPTNEYVYIVDGEEVSREEYIRLTHNYIKMYRTKSAGNTPEIPVYDTEYYTE